MPTAEHINRGKIQYLWVSNLMGLLHFNQFLFIFAVIRLGIQGAVGLAREDLLKCANSIQPNEILYLWVPN